jgi:hypothetical protein
MYMLLNYYCKVHVLTPWRRVLLGKLIVTHIVKKFRAFCGSRRFIKVFTIFRHRSLSWARCIQSKPFHSVSSKPVLILSSLPLVSLPSCLFTSDCTTKMFIFISPLHATCPAHPLLGLITLANVCFTLILEQSKTKALQFTILTISNLLGICSYIANDYPLLLPASLHKQHAAKYIDF